MKRLFVFSLLVLLLSLSGCSDDEPQFVNEGNTIIQVDEEELAEIISNKYYTEDEVKDLLSDYNELLITVWFDDTDDYEFIIEDGTIKETQISTGDIEYFTYDEFIEQAMEDIE